MAIKEKDLPVSGSYGPGVYVRTVSASGASQKTGFAAMKEALDPTVDSALSTSSTNAVQNKVITGAVNDLKEDISTLENSMLSKPKTPKYDRTLTGTEIVLNDKGINNFSMASANGLVYPVNIWKYASSASPMSSYNSHFVVTNENNGLKIVKDTFNTQIRYNILPIVVPFTGYIYGSCDAHTTHPTVQCAIDFRIGNAYGSAICKQSKGDRHLICGTYVEAGQTVYLCCYAGASDENENTWYYENIMLSYSLYADYEPFSAITSNYSKDVDLTTLTGETATVGPDAVSGGYRVNYNVALTSPFIPTSNNVVADNFEIITNEPNTLKLVAANSVYTAAENNLIGITTTGNITIYHNGLAATAMKEWVKSIGLVVRYVPNSGSYTGTEKKRAISAGNVIKYNSSNTVNYNCTNPTKRKCVCFGDSVTGMFDNGGGYVGALNYYCDDVTYVNCGFSGCRWTDHSDPLYMPFSMNRIAEAIVTNDYSLQNASGKVISDNANYDKLFADHLATIKTTDFKDIDVVTIYYGLNDFASNAIVNTADDPSTENKQRTNVESAVKYTIEQLLTKYPNLTIIIISPYWSYILNSNSNVTPNSSGKYLIDYCTVIEDSGKSYNMNTINLYKSLGVTMQNRTMYLLDNAHPNFNLSKMIANKIKEAVGDHN